MSPIFSAILTSSLLIMFTSFLSTKIDQTVTWNWFLVFMPIFILQTFYLIDSLVLIVKKRTLFHTYLYAFTLSLILIFAFETMLCLKLEYFPELMLTFVFIPIWVILIMLIIYLLIKLSK